MNANICVTSVLSVAHNLSGKEREPLSFTRIGSVTKVLIVQIQRFSDFLKV